MISYIYFHSDHVIIIYTANTEERANKISYRSYCRNITMLSSRVKVVPGVVSDVVSYVWIYRNMNNSIYRVMQYRTCLALHPLTS